MILLYNILSSLLTVYSFALIIYIFMSWVPNARETSIGRVLASLCEPYLEPFRKIIPPIGMIDISPIVAIFVLNFAKTGLAAVFRMLSSI
ncbi:MULTISPECIES: YggT family protein [Bacillus]|uniref:YggT family protein n=1 Tax=Bacillus glycinifermentans TaxID=1664069 RepID=A0AAJ4D241_9BACI|nr:MULTISPECIES: YggT family protein [Bacillus]KKB73823.1 membrane protein [Bacillus sp. TH008]MDU0071942.1 YggT family protein [Bacillus sp. IG6]MED8019605.1 YggT family protein [Bacillus glycinifermentans]NUJ18162.1 YggT family protein [Bacillus glycinifermentans]QAT65040.1 YggT family protein [Bacillus glycinifermentans]